MILIFYLPDRVNIKYNLYITAKTYTCCVLYARVLRMARRRFPFRRPATVAFNRVSSCVVYTYDLNDINLDVVNDSARVENISGERVRCKVEKLKLLAKILTYFHTDHIYAIFNFITRILLEFRIVQIEKQQKPVTK